MTWNTRKNLMPKSIKSKFGIMPSKEGEVKQIFYVKENEQLIFGLRHICDYRLMGIYMTGYLKVIEITLELIL